jgi:hypothetical protein
MLTRTDSSAPDTPSWPLKKKAEDRFLVLNGDVLPDEASLQEMMRGDAQSRPSRSINPGDTCISAEGDN